MRRDLIELQERVTETLDAMNKGQICRRTIRKLIVDLALEVNDQVDNRFQPFIPDTIEEARGER